MFLAQKLKHCLYPNVVVFFYYKITWFWMSPWFRSKVHLEIDNRQCSQHSKECISSADQAAAFIAAENLKSELSYPVHSVSSKWTDKTGLQQNRVVVFTVFHYVIFVTNLFDLRPKKSTSPNAYCCVPGCCGCSYHHADFGAGCIGCQAQTQAWDFMASWRLSKEWQQAERASGTGWFWHEVSVHLKSTTILDLLPSSHLGKLLYNNLEFFMMWLCLFSVLQFHISLFFSITDKYVF